MATVTIKTNRTFSDLDLNFKLHPVKKDVNILLNEIAISNSIKNLVLTNHYERPFQPEVGSNIRRLLFDNLDAITTNIEREIRETVDNFEPRAKVHKVTAVAAPDQNGYKMKLEFFVLNNTSPITINFFLERVR